MGHLEGNKYTSSFWRFYANTKKKNKTVLTHFPFTGGIRVIPTVGIGQFPRALL